MCKNEGGSKKEEKSEKSTRSFFFVSFRLSHCQGVGRSREREGDSITETARERKATEGGEKRYTTPLRAKQEREAASENDVKRETERSSEGGRETLRLGELTPLPSPHLSSPSPPSSLLQELVCRSGEYSVTEAT